MLVHISLNRSNGFCSILPPIIRQEALCPTHLLRFHGTHRHLVRMVACRLDQHVPSTGEMRSSEQKVVYHYRILACLLQQRYSICPITGPACSERPHSEEEVVDCDFTSTRMLVGQTPTPLIQYLLTHRLAAPY